MAATRPRKVRCIGWFLSFHPARRCRAPCRARRAGAIRANRRWRLGVGNTD